MYKIQTPKLTVVTPKIRTVPATFQRQFHHTTITQGRLYTVSSTIPGFSHMLYETREESNREPEKPQAAQKHSQQKAFKQSLKKEVFKHDTKPVHVGNKSQKH